MYMSKVGPIWHFSVLSPPASGDTMPKPEFYCYLMTSKNAENCQFHARKRPVLILRLRWPDSRESIRRFARIAWFSRIVSGFPNWIPFFRIALRRGGGRAKIANRRFEAIRANRSHAMKIGCFSANRFARIDSQRESAWFALRIAGPSKFFGARKPYKRIENAFLPNRTMFTPPQVGNVISRQKSNQRLEATINRFGGRQGQADFPGLLGQWRLRLSTMSPPPPPHSPTQTKNHPPLPSPAYSKNRMSGQLPSSAANLAIRNKDRHINIF